jgi:hypothetical protein
VENASGWEDFGRAKTADGCLLTKAQLIEKLKVKPLLMV